MQENEVIEQSVQIYGLLWESFARSLKAKKKPVAKSIAALKVANKGDVSKADELLREKFQYNSRRPNDPAPVGFYPLLGLATCIHHMASSQNVYALSDHGTFVGHFSEFNMEIERYLREISEVLEEEISSLKAKVTRIFHKVPPLPSYTPNRLLAYKKKRDTDSSYEDAYYVRVGRCRVTTWKFGEIHQCCVDIVNPLSDDDSTRIAFPPCDSAESALEKGIVWAESFATDHYTVERVFKDCFEHWPSLYQTRTDVIEQLFFTIGNGYEWLDGGIVCCGPEDHLESPSRKRLLDPTRVDPMLAELEKCGDSKLADKMRELYFPKEPVVGPHPDDGIPRHFYPVCDYSKICHVPKDVKDDWLLVAYEAALILRDRSKAVPYEVLGKMRDPNAEEIERQVKNAGIGVKIVKDLNTRFEDRLIKLGVTLT